MNQLKKPRVNIVAMMLFQAQPNTKYKVVVLIILTYSTTILPVYKIVEKDDSRLVLVFYFTDGLFYIVYKKELFDTFETKHITYYRSGSSNSPVLHFMIPTKELTKIEI